MNKTVYLLNINNFAPDLTALTYSGLLKATPQGTYVPDLAQSYTISPDGKTYTFTLRSNATFQDGTPVTADDVAFTVAKVQDPALNSPQEANWTGVTVTEINPHTIQFVLTQAYAPFIENLTMGILPKHLWGSISDDQFDLSQLNTSPVGSGPFTVVGITRTSAGVPSSYDLKPFAHYALGAAYLDDLTLRFYQSESDLLAALKSGAIGAASGITPEDLSQLQGFNVRTAPLDRVFGVFFNQNQSAVLRDPAVRQALNDAIDKNELVKEVLGGYGVPLNGPVPPGILASMGLSDSVPPESTSTDPALAAQKELLADGWTLNANGILQKTTGSGKGATVETLSFTLTTGDVPELDAAAQFLRATWAHMGAQVTVQVYDQGDLTQNVIRPRQYDALLFGEVVNRELDLFAFWDSSQRVDPGLNIALYANSTADKALEQLRQTSDPTQRAALYTQFDAQIQKDLPAIFLYAPDFVYIVPNSIQGVDLGSIEEPSDRFLSITAWHTETDSVWPLFASHL